jgi:hypothetical protein
MNIEDAKRLLIDSRMVLASSIKYCEESLRNLQAKTGLKTKGDQQTATFIGEDLKHMKQTLFQLQQLK